MVYRFTGSSNKLKNEPLQQLGRAVVGIAGFQAGFGFGTALGASNNQNLGVAGGLLGGLIGANVAVNAYDGISNGKGVKKRLFF